MATTRVGVRKRVIVPAVLGLVALLATSVVIAVPGQAAPSPSIAQVEARVNVLNDQAEAANEKRNELNAQVADTNARIVKVRQRIADQTATLTRVRAQLGVFAAAAYRSGGMDTTLQLLLSDDPTTFLDQSSSLDAVARGQQGAMRRVAAAQQQLDQSKIELGQTVAQQRKVAAAASAASADINAKAAEAQHLLNSLKAADRARLVAAQQSRAAAAQRASRAALRSVAAPGASSSSSSLPSYSGPASGRAAVAVAYARAQVGKSYVWGASGPNSFDCSGLTMAAWRAAGVSLPHYTNAQYAATRHVSRSDMQPGDLIFFHSDLHHVGIYIGGGVFVHAQSSATGVVVSSVGGWWSSSIAGIGRP